jgi:REP element-mobilizing transposase RayT
MQLFKHNYYHIYNRTINREQLFYFGDNYEYFLKKISGLKKYLKFHGFCLMPTHFHFLVQVLTDDQDSLRRKIGDILSGYTKSINKQYGRTGSLFQQHTKAKLIANEKYLLSTLYYIHQNPVLSGLVENLSEWRYSSYREYTGIEQCCFCEIEEILDKFESMDDFIEKSNIRVDLMKM